MTNALPRGLPLWLIYLTSGDTRLPPRTRTATEGKFFLSTEMPVSSEKSAFLGRIIIPSSPVLLLSLSPLRILLIFVARHIAARGQGERFPIVSSPATQTKATSLAFPLPFLPVPRFKYLRTSARPIAPANAPAMKPSLSPRPKPRSSNLLGATAGRGHESGVTG